MDTAKKTGERLRAARNESGLTQAEVAEALETHTITVSRWERGEWLPSEANQVKLCQLYGKRLEDLFPDLEAAQEGKRRKDNEITVEIHIPANLREVQSITITVTPPGTTAQEDQRTISAAPVQAHHLHVEADVPPYLARLRNPQEANETPTV